MRTLVYLEPLWFRESATFLKGHIDSFVAPLLRALYHGAHSGEIHVASNILLSLEFVNSLRDLNLGAIETSIFSITSTHALQDCGFRTDIYAADVFSNDRVAIDNHTLFDRMSRALQCRPDVVVTTAQNRYLRQLCDDASIPLISCEFGPLPRTPYPLNRFLSLDGHMSDGPLGSPEALRRTLAAKNREHQDPAVLHSFYSHYMAAISQHESYEPCRKFIEKIADGGSVALLALQPEDWLTWEGALGSAQGAAPLILNALRAMTSDKLIVIFHADPRGRVVGDQFAEIWLSNPALVRMPEALSVNTSECILPYVDEVITVSSNVAMSAFLLGKRVTALGKSFATTLSKLGADPDTAAANRAALLWFLFKDYCVPNDVFSSPPDLQAVIRSLVEHKFGSAAALEAQGDAPVRHRPHPQDTLEQLHEKIREHVRVGGYESGDHLARLFGRHSIGYLVPEGAVGAELGVAGGKFSDSLLLSGRFATLYSVDSWSDHHDDAEYQAACDRLSRHGERSVVLRKTFDEALGQIPDASLDFIYIDAYAHTGVAADILRAWLPKLKNQAIISGHDFCDVNWAINHERLTATFNELGFEVTTIPEAFTFDNEDLFPSFFAWWRVKPDSRLGCGPP